MLSPVIQLMGVPRGLREDVVYHLPSMQTMLATIKEEG